jgi:hypothetical protein
MGRGALVNLPCPCGSGRKLKRCCGSPERRVDASGVGWNGRLQRRPLRPAECASVAASLRDSERELGLTLHPRSDLADMIRELEAFSKEADPAGNPARPTFDRAFIIDQASRIASALEHLRGVQGFDQVKKWLGKRLNRLRTQTQEAQDHLFEIEIAGRLAQAGAAIELPDPPDIVATLPPFGAVPIECKRPRNARSAIRALREGSRTIEKAGRPGVLVVSLEVLLNTTPAGKVMRWRAPTMDALERALRDDIHRLVDAILGRFELVGPNSAAGIIWVGIASALIDEPRSYGSSWAHLTTANRAMPASEGLIRRLGRDLFEAGPRFGNR